MSVLASPAVKTPFVETPLALTSVYVHITSEATLTPNAPSKVCFHC